MEVGGERDVLAKQGLPPLDPSMLQRRTFRLLRVSGPVRGWIPTLGDWNDPPRVDRLPSGGVEVGVRRFANRPYGEGERDGLAVRGLLSLEPSRASRLGGWIGVASATG